MADIPREHIINAREAPPTLKEVEAFCTAVVKKTLDTRRYDGNEMRRAFDACAQILPGLHRPTDRTLLADLFKNLARACYIQREPQQALICARPALKIYTALLAWEDLSIVAGNIGKAYNQLGQPERAALFTKAAKKFKGIDDQEGKKLARTLIKTLDEDAKSLDKPRSGEVSSDDATTQQGRDAVPDVKPVIEKAKEELTTYTPRLRGRRGYGAKSRVGTKHIGAYLPKDLAIALNKKVRKEGTTIQELFERLATEYVGETLPRKTREKLLEREIAERRAELGLT